MNVITGRTFESLAYELKSIKERNVGIFAATTGAGAGLQQMLWSLPGSSSYLLGSSLPYNQRLLEEHIGFRPERFCTEETAVEMAIASYIKAKTALYDNKEFNRSALGLGLTASVASTEIHRGDHRIHAAFVSDATFLGTNCVTANVTIKKDAGLAARLADGAYSDEVAFQLLLHALGFTCSFGSHPLGEVDLRESSHILQHCILSHSIFHPDGRRETLDKHIVPITSGDGETAIFPGSFNPPHEGHFNMAHKIADERPLGVRRVMFSVNLDYPIDRKTGKPSKAPLAPIQALDRVAYFAHERQDHGHPVVINTAQPLYFDKSLFYPRTPFVIGMDTIERMFEVGEDGVSDWGGLRPVELCEFFVKNGTRFIYYPRQKYSSLDNVLLKVGGQNAITRFSHLFHRMKYEWPLISSTEIRTKRGA
jgi:nicotinic acid mononucleotide adenylyltransferase